MLDQGVLLLLPGNGARPAGGSPEAGAQKDTGSDSVSASGNEPGETRTGSPNMFKVNRNTIQIQQNLISSKCIK